MDYSNTTPTITTTYLKYHVKYDGKTIETTVTSKGEIAEEWVNGILLVYANIPKVVVGFDFQPPGHILQLCIDTKCLILQLRYMNEIPQSFKNFLMNPRFTFMGVDGDFARLVSDKGLDCAKSEDIRTAVINKWPKKFLRHDLDYLANTIAGISVIKPYQINSMSWGGKVLDEKQVLYACIVAYASYKIGLNLMLEN